MFSYSGALGGGLTGLLVVLSLVVCCWCTLHYWLRPIKRGQFRFANFAPQMSLSLSKSLSFASIPLVKIGENSKNSIFFILEVQFHHEGGLMNVVI